MSLCYRIKQLWRWILYGGPKSKTNKYNETSQSGNAYDNKKQRGLRTLESQCSPESSHGEDKTAESSFVSHEEMIAFSFDMDELYQSFKQDVEQIQVQHQRLRAGRIILRRRVTEMESILKTEINNINATKLKTNKESDYLNSQDRQLIEELEEVLEQLEKEQDELSFLIKYLEIEIRERTLYPEPPMPKVKRLEDEFSKQMRIAGGLSYESRDKSIQFLTYQSLPPPLSLSQLLHDNNRMASFSVET